MLVLGGAYFILIGLQTLSVVAGLFRVFGLAIAYSWGAWPIERAAAGLIEWAPPSSVFDFSLVAGALTLIGAVILVAAPSDCRGRGWYAFIAASVVYSLANLCSACFVLRGDPIFLPLVCSVFAVIAFGIDRAYKPNAVLLQWAEADG